jgi:hypothetical protein
MKARILTTEFPTKSFSPSCEQRHTLKPRNQASFQADFPCLDGERIMTQLSDSTWMVIHSMMATLLVLAWVYIPA